MSFTMKDAYSVMLREYPDVMNIEQMSQALGVSTKTGYGLLKSGKVACLKVGRAYRIPKAWCEMRGVTVTSEIKRFVMSELDKYYAELDRLHIFDFFILIWYNVFNSKLNLSARQIGI